MMEIKVEVNNSCKNCKNGLAYLKKLYKQNKNAYMSFTLHPLPKSDEELMKRKIKGILLIPDYNSSGHLTHFHIEKEK